MPDLRKMTVESLRALARKVLGPGHSRLKTKAELVSALEEAGAGEPARAAPSGTSAAKAAPRAKPAAKAKPGPSVKPARPGPGARVRAAAGRAVKATGEAVRAVKQAAGEVARRGAKKPAREAAAEVAEAGVPAPSKAAKPGRPGAAARAARAGAGAAIGAVVGAKAGAAPARARKAGKAATAAAAVAGAAVGAAVGAAAGARAGRRKAAARRPRGAVPDAEGFFVARVRGEDAVREAPHPLVEPEPEDEEVAGEEAEGTPSGAPAYDEGLGDLPWGYGDDAFVALPRDPRTLFLYWDWSGATLDAAFQGLEHGRSQLWVFARSGAGWERVRVIDFALESRGYYVHDLEPGRAYRAEIHVVDRRGAERLVARPSNPVGLPPSGPSGVVDDRFVRIPWDMPLGRLLGPGHAGGPFSDEVRALLARLSDWSRFGSAPVWGGSAGGMGGRPSSPTAAPSSPGRPVDPREK
ncbi:conserved hypothetical protein [Anaeromyxobacter sp. K]|uniref:DUF4912 domain-containing protein n=1 Tax=Anaeromyxobacter sp. (strain K) TaxID=447217 RepID=UPI00017BE254|nr:DUF4912 domain-containing protein [Anaeromyxobacter sp. K]ACG72367.1 conserved hypothetical protein [Anaeromyxobacter sp. K]